MEKLVTDTFKIIGGCCTDCSDYSTCAFLKFSLICMFFGFIVVCVDFMTFHLAEYSFLKMRYAGWKRTSFVFLFWTLCSLLVGYLGAATKLFDTDKVVSALFVAFSWQFIVARWASGQFENEDVQPENAV